MHKIITLIIGDMVTEVCYDTRTDLFYIKKGKIGDDGTEILTVNSDSRTYTDIVKYIVKEIIYAEHIDFATFNKQWTDASYEEKRKLADNLKKPIMVDVFGILGFDDTEKATLSPKVFENINGIISKALAEKIAKEENI